MTVAGRTAPPCTRTVAVAAVSEKLLMARENVAVGDAVTGTRCALFAGVVATVGGGETVKLQLNGAARAAPADDVAAVHT